MVVHYYQSAWLFPSIIAIGGAATTCEAHVRDLREKKKSGHVFDRIATRDVLDERDAHVDEVAHLGLSPSTGAFLIIAWIITLVALGIVVSKTDYASSKEVHWFEAFWRAGSIIFGGGRVVLLLLLNGVVQYETTCSVVNGTLGCLKSEALSSWVTKNNSLLVSPWYKRCQGRYLT